MEAAHGGCWLCILFGAEAVRVIRSSCYLQGYDARVPLAERGKMALVEVLIFVPLLLEKFP